MMERLQHDRQIEARVGKRNGLRACFNELDAGLRVGEVFLMLNRIDLECGNRAAWKPLGQSARHVGRSASEFDDALGVEPRNGVKFVEFVIDQGHAVGVGGDIHRGISKS